MRRTLRLFLWAPAVVFLLSCGGTSSNSSQTVSPDPPSSAVQAQHVFLVVEENQSYESVIGSTSWPYLNSLAQKYGLATQYYANTHPSIGNYFMLTTGQIITNNDSFTGTVDVDNLVRELVKSGKSWKDYAEALPAVGYLGGDVYPYSQHHNPFVYFSDVVNNTAQQQNIVPFTQFSNDLANGNLPQFVYILPDLQDDAHDGTPQAADQWLQANVAPLLASPAFQQGGLLIITFDESADTDTTNGGGHVATLIISPMAKGGHRSTTLYQHPSTLRLMLQSLGVSAFPGASASAPSMQEFF